MQNEANVSAAQHEKENDARISQAHEHEERPPGSEKEESERKKTPERLIVREDIRMQSRSLKKNSQFRLVYSEGKREAGTKVVIYFLKRESDGVVPGFVASKKIGKACQRNRAKRLHERDIQEIGGSLHRHESLDRFCRLVSPEGMHVPRDLGGRRKLVGKGWTHFNKRMISRILTRIGLAALHIYRVAVSPYHPPVCRFTPSCSRYAEDALRLHGPGKGTALAIRRVLRCHPFSSGGYDPVR